MTMRDSKGVRHTSSRVCGGCMGPPQTSYIYIYIYIYIDILIYIYIY